MPGNPLSITLPTVGVTVGPTYATNINTALQALIDDIEAKIVPGEIDINADMSFSSAGTSYGATNVDRVNLFEQAGTLGGGNINTVYAYNDELYFQDGTGNNVALTAAGSVAGAAGNITTTGSPAYATSDVELLWSGGDLEYRFKSGTGDTYADLVFKNAEFRDGANTLRMAPNASMSGDYTLTWPAAVSSAGQVVELDGVGNISFVDTLSTAKTFTGLITASAGVTAAANQHVTVSGTGEYKHGTESMFIHASAGNIHGDGHTFSNGELSMTVGENLYISIPLRAGDRIINVYAYVNGGNTGAKNVYLYSKNGADGLAPDQRATQVSSLSGEHTISMTSINWTLGSASDDAVYFQFQAQGSPDSILGIRVEYDRP